MSIIKAFDSEISRISIIVDGEYTNKSISETEKFVQIHNFDKPLINWMPISRVSHSFGAAGQMMYNGNIKIQFLTIANKNDSAETQNDFLIDEMFTLSEHFFDNLRKNTNKVFNQPVWSFESDILRFYTSNYCVGVETSVVFTTACNRI